MGMHCPNTMFADRHLAEQDAYQARVENVEDMVRENLLIDLTQDEFIEAMGDYEFFDYLKNMLKQRDAVKVEETIRKALFSYLFKRRVDEALENGE